MKLSPETRIIITYDRLANLCAVAGILLLCCLSMVAALTRWPALAAWCANKLKNL